ncbi:hypothetical protein G8A07_11910 [Roseateles sp. DAIF2]|uniref:hypothetical protein n=1 Tax=Roseateles sp. DAIF2 TaxID=2714952 RepID=UPI0018A293A1|nr:hypothetical protein [Roseateles sp. DAIF2]QPF73556.1 hypothetical protein G8A07_11910 [Roseateles sp. DAIF2]
MSKTPRLPRLLCLGAALLALAGCTTPSASPGWDQRFGESMRALQAQQVVDPAAPQRHAQENGKADGRTVREARERQVDSYKAPPPSNVINIGVGAGR